MPNYFTSFVSTIVGGIERGRAPEELLIRTTKNEATKAPRMVMEVLVLIRLEDLVEVEIEPRRAEQTITPEMADTFLGNNLFDQEQGPD
jgi:hypothetical protein